MKKKQAPVSTPPIEEPNLSDKLNDHPYIQWIAERRSSLIYFFIGVIVLIYLLTKITTTAAGKAEADYIQAEKNFSTLQTELYEGSSWETASESLDKLEAKIKEYPELHAKYDGPLAQILIAAGDTAAALPFAEKALNRTDSESRKFFYQFSQTTLLISNKDFQNALTHSVNLQKQMIDSDRNQSTGILFAYNLLRVGLLHQELSNKKDELQVWNEWDANVKNKSDGFVVLVNHFNKENISIVNYIEARKKAIQ